MRKIILASQSPRRQELLRQIGLEFTCMPSCKEERTTKTEPSEVVVDLARQKAEDIASQLQNQWILAADTAVVCEKRILGKPKDAKHAKQMLLMLQGKRHQVYTGVCLINQVTGEKLCFSECTSIEIYPMNEQEILDYIGTGEPFDKAGAYAIQGRFAAYIKGIEGDYYNVVGLPVARVYQVLKSW